MCDRIEDEMDWVFELKPDLWKDAPTAIVPVNKMSATQIDVTIGGMANVAEMVDKNYKCYEHILLIRTDDGRYLIRDGHHRFTLAFLRGKTELVAQVIPDPRSF